MGAAMDGENATFPQDSRLNFVLWTHNAEAKKYFMLALPNNTCEHARHTQAHRQRDSTRHRETLRDQTNRSLRIWTKTYQVSVRHAGSIIKHSETCADVGIVLLCVDVLVIFKPLLKAVGFAFFWCLSAGDVEDDLIRESSTQKKHRNILGRIQGTPCA